MTKLKVLSEIIKETLWPTRCAICDSFGEILCENCRANLDYIDILTSCKRCGAPYGHIQCSECVDIEQSDGTIQKYMFKETRSAIIANKNSLKIIKVYKDKSEIRLQYLIAQIMSHYIDPKWIDNIKAITYIPSTQKAFLKRGYDHMQLIALQLSKITNIPLLSIFKRPESNDQRKLSRKMRELNVKTKFQPKIEEVIKLREDDGILIIDDVFTTGATMNAAAFSLKNAGMKNIYGLTFLKVMD